MYKVSYAIVYNVLDSSNMAITNYITHYKKIGTGALIGNERA